MKNLVKLASRGCYMFCRSRGPEHAREVTIGFKKLKDAQAFHMALAKAIVALREAGERSEP